MCGICGRVSDTCVTYIANGTCLLLVVTYISCPDNSTTETTDTCTGDNILS